MTNGVESPRRRFISRAPAVGSMRSLRSAASPVSVVSPSNATTDGIDGPWSPSGSVSGSPPGAYRAAAVHVVPRSTPIVVPVPSLMSRAYDRLLGGVPGDVPGCGRGAVVVGGVVRPLPAGCEARHRRLVIVVVVVRAEAGDTGLVVDAAEQG